MTAGDFETLVCAARDPWRFLTLHVSTQDPARGTIGYPCYPYLRKLVLAAENRRFLLVPKSRQMLVTWTMVAYMLWRALFREPGVYLFLSRNERCAEELIFRLRFVLDQLPAAMRPRLKTNSREEIAFARLGSRILSLPATPNGPRMYSPTGVFWDEMAFTPYDDHIWAALKPALDSGGRFIGVSSSGGAANLFARWVTAEAPPNPPARGGESESGLPPLAGGIRGGGGTEGGALFSIHRIHYSMHPEKATDEWRQRASRGLSSARWQQEQEISFDAVSDLVYSEFDPQRHILPGEWEVHRDWEIYRSIDFGYRHPFVLWVQRTPDGEFVVFDEWSAADRTTEEMLIAIRNVDYAHGIGESNVSWTACDPAGAAAQDAGLSPVDVLRRAGMKLRYRSSRIQPGIERVKSSLADAGGRVSLRFSPRCRNLIADFGRYRWAGGGEEPVKDGLCDHSMDSLRYFFVNFDTAEEVRPFAPRMAGMRR